MQPPSIAHLIDFIAVLDHGGLSAGAQSLGRAQAAVSYSIQSLERDLGVTLFDRTARPLRPTAHGLTLATAAREIVRDVTHLQTRAEGLRQGLESEVTLAVDSLVPMHALLPLVTAFADAFPAVDLDVHMDPMAAPLRSVLDGQAAIGICGSMALRESQVRAIPFARVKRVAVAAPSHPLAQMVPPISRRSALRHRRIVMLDRDRGPLPRDQAHHSWRTTDIGAKREMLIAGLGWGNMPLHLIEGDLAAKRLITLRFLPDVAEHWTSDLNFFVVVSLRRAVGPATRWLLDRVQSQAEASDPRG